MKIYPGNMHQQDIGRMQKQVAESLAWCDDSII